MPRKPLRLSHDSSLLPRGALVEYIPIGNVIKVTAVDPVTYIEVSIVGNPQLSQRALAHEAVRKLEYIIRKKHRQAQSQNSVSGIKPKDDRGKLI
ncbi:MAG: hypothetical protein AB8B77_08960 [Alphaproteobacteria bacterium]